MRQISYYKNYNKILTLLRNTAKNPATEQNTLEL